MPAKAVPMALVSGPPKQAVLMRGGDWKLCFEGFQREKYGPACAGPWATVRLSMPGSCGFLR